MAKSILAAARLHDVLDYSKTTGLFHWKIRTSNRIKVGDVAGALNPVTGYLSISIDGRLYRANRLAWFYVTGEWPLSDVDHEDGIRTNNRFSNLRDVSRGVNLENQRVARSNNKSSGLLGVSSSKDRSKKWRASIREGGKSKHLGRFDTKEEAHEVYLTAKRQLHTGCTI